MTYRYSPLPMDRYRLIGIPTDEVGVIQSSEYPNEAWNLFWLSNPGIDVVPVLGADWWKDYRPHPDTLVAVMSDVAEDEALFRKLTMHPDVFMAWFGREDHTIFDSYDKLGGRAWVSIVLERAEEAARRILAEQPLDITQFLPRTT